MTDSGAGSFLARLTAKLRAANVPHMVVGSLEEMQRRTEGDLLGAKVFVASPEDTLISKLEWAKLGGGDELDLEDLWRRVHSRTNPEPRWAVSPSGKVFDRS